MTSEDRIKNLERIVSELSRNQAGQWIRIAGGGGGGGGDSEIRRSVSKATDDIPARSGTTPGSSTDIEVVLGDEPDGAVLNYSTVEIPSLSYLVIMQIDDADVIVNAFC